MRVSNSLNAVDFRIGCTFTANCDFLLVWIALPKNHSFNLLNMLPAYYKNKLAIGSFFYSVSFPTIFGRVTLDLHVPYTCSSIRKLQIKLSC